MTIRKDNAALAVSVRSRRTDGPNYFAGLFPAFFLGAIFWWFLN